MFLTALGVIIGVLVSRTPLATRAYTAAANRLSFLPRP